MQIRNVAHRQSVQPGWINQLSRAAFRPIAIGAAVLTACMCLQSSSQAAGVWTPLTNVNPAGGSGVMALLTDGTIMVQGPNVSKVWNKLTPDSSGNYINGTWTSLASMSTERLFFGSNLLPSGKVFVIGGEYSGPLGFQNITNSGEIYDPVSNTWTPIATFPQPFFGDDPTVVLPSGKVLCGFIFDATTYLYNPATNSWTQTGTKLRQDRSDEENFMLLPNGIVLSYDIFASDTLRQGHAQRYNTFTGTWSDAGLLPAILSSVQNNGAELGPYGLLPNGKLILIGANNKSAIYTPTTNSWVAGPSLPVGLGADDTPGAMLPNGHFIFLADTTSPAIFSPPTRLFDYNYLTNTLTDITPINGPGPLMATSNAFPFRMLNLPNGHLLLSHRDTSTLYDYAPDGAPLASWAPTIVSVAKVGPPSSTTYTLTGTQLTGISEGSTYGDDVEMSTNYPIVRLKSSKGVVSHARTSNWTPGVATGSLRTTVQFVLPPSLPNDLYQLTVVANGIPSVAQDFRVGAAVFPSNVIAVYNSGTKTLTLTGDSNPNSLTVSLQAGVLKVEGANGTTINSTTSFSTAHSGKLVLVANLNDGDDSISIIGVDSSTTNITLGAGNDKAAFTLSNFGTATVDGGAGVLDALLITSSKITTLVEKNFP